MAVIQGRCPVDGPLYDPRCGYCKAFYFEREAMTVDDEYDPRWEQLADDISHLDPLYCTQCERGLYAGDWIHITEEQNVILCRACAPSGGRPIALRDDD